MGDGGKSLRRMDESVVVENLRSTLVEVPNSGGWGVRVLREERAMNRSPKYVCQGACATSAHSDPSLSPHFAKRAVRALQAWSFPWERVCCSFPIRSSRLHTVE